MNGLKILSLFSIGLLLVACEQQNSSTAAPVEVDVSVKAEPEPQMVGRSTLIVTLKDASGSAVDSATVQVHGDMDHEGMAPVDREVSESVNGEYRVPFDWTMGGGWIVTVTARLPGGGEISETFDFFVEAVSSDSIINRNAASSGPAVQVDYEPDNDPAIAGDATVTITLAGEGGLPITNAVVEVIGDMAHPGMLPISGAGEHIGNGRYTVPLHWSMTGSWQVTVNITLPDGSTVVEIFDQQVIMPEN